MQVAATNYRVPDVVVFDRSREIEQILTHAPIAVFEVLSPEDSVYRLTRKLADYASMGILNMYVVDPRTDSAFRYARGSLELCREETQALQGSAAIVDWTAVKALRD